MRSINYPKSLIEKAIQLNETSQGLPFKDKICAAWVRSKIIKTRRSVQQFCNDSAKQKSRRTEDRDFIFNSEQKLILFFKHYPVGLPAKKVFLILFKKLVLKSTIEALDTSWSCLVTPAISKRQLNIATKHRCQHRSKGLWLKAYGHEYGLRVNPSVFTYHKH